MVNRIAENSKRFNKKFGYDKETVSEKLTVRDFVGMMRTLNEEIDAVSPRQITQVEVDREIEKIRNYFEGQNMNVDFDFTPSQDYQPLHVYDGAVTFGGTIDGQLMFLYRVTGDEKTSGVDIKYLDGFDPRDPENDKIIKMVQLYFKEFSEYWRKNELELDNN